MIASTDSPIWQGRELSGKSIFVTGGTGVVGEALIAQFAATGASIFFQYSQNTIKAKELERLYGAKGIQINFLDHFIPPALDIDILVNSAGVNITKSELIFVDDEEWRHTLRINLDVPFILCRHYLPRMQELQWGRIINISSLYGIRGSVRNGPYNTSKHGLAGLTKSIALEYGKFGITANDVCPGPIRSELMVRIAQKAVADGRAIDVPSYLQTVANSVPTHRLVEASEVASIVVFLCLPQAAAINGVAVMTDGGMAV